MNSPSKKPLILWILWFAALNGLIVLHVVVGKGVPLGSNPASEPFSPVLAIGLVAIVLSAAVRWFLIPKAEKPETRLTLMIVGLALNEAAALLGLFLVPPSFPETKLTLFSASLIGILQFAPIFTTKEKAAKSEFHQV